MKPSPHDGKPVAYVDHFKLAHTGRVVGQSNDGKWLLVQSDNPNVKPADWHFQIAADWFAVVKA